MKIFISGPITGTTDYMERFSNAQKYLESLGHSVINPVLVTSNLPEDTTQKEYLSLDLTMLCMCDAIYMLKGYLESEGALAELHTAKSIGCEIFYESMTGEVPSADPFSKWISCKNKLPKPNELVGPVPKYYLIQTIFEDMYVARYTSNGWIPINSSYALASEDAVVVWMELPVPYKESEESE
jgi:hypothetical protein